MNFEFVQMTEPYILYARVVGDSTPYCVNLEFMFKKTYWYTSTTHYGLALPSKRHAHYPLVNKYRNLENRLLVWEYANTAGPVEIQSELLDVRGLKYHWEKQKTFSPNDLVKLSKNVLMLMGSILLRPKDYQRELNSMAMDGSQIIAMLQCAPLRPYILQAAGMR